jgi:hypothetical protein
MPLGLRRPEANTRCCAGGAVDFPDGGAAFFGLHAVLADVAVGAHGDVELAAVGLAMMFLVQWWLIGPAGRSTTLTGAAVMRVWPGWYGKRTTASVLAT